MKTLQRRLLACLAASLAASAMAERVSLPPPAMGQAGYFKLTHGDVQIVDPGGAARPAAPGSALAPGERVVTDANAGAGVRLRDGTLLVVGRSSNVDLNAFDYDPSTHQGNVAIKLIRGTLRMITGAIGKADPQAVRVDTPTTTLGVRGTDFIVQVD